MAKQVQWYKFTFMDGTLIWARGLSAQERKCEEKRHGKLVSKVKAE